MIGFDDTAATTMQTYDGAQPRMGFFTDTTLCIGCKACEVACKEWNQIPEDGYTFTGESYDNTSALGGNTWRHVAFVEQLARTPGPAPAVAPLPSLDAGMPHGNDIMAMMDGGGPAALLERDAAVGPMQFDTMGRWLMSSDVCKHCTRAACLDVCPTGALFRSEFGTVVVQDDVCNGCGYCVPACPFGVIEEQPQSGHAAKCTLCYDRLRDGEKPACAKACPTESIQFGDLNALHARADQRLQAIGTRYEGARLYGRDSADGVGGFGAFFLLLDEPEVYGLPPDPIVTTRDLPQMWRLAAVAALGLGVSVFAASLGTGSR
ncbi:MAG: 4Fe-4S dicluster domain-containing protein [Vulcanimicrobiaceae bacterium]